MFAATIVLAASTGASAQTCEAAGAQPARIVAVDDGLDLLLADGRVAVLAGVAAEPAAQGYSGFVERLAGTEIWLAALQPQPDRWGRVAAAAFSGDAGDNIAEQFLTAGLGLYRPDSSARPCRDRLLAAERAAREAKRGLWGGTRPAVLDASDAKAVLAAPKGYVVIEGRVLTIGEQRGRLYLNFGRRRTTDFAIVISKRNLAQFDAASIPLRQLVGRHVRARGLLDRGFGPMMEIASPDALELLDGVTDAAELKR